MPRECKSRSYHRTENRPVGVHGKDQCRHEGYRMSGRKTTLPLTNDTEEFLLEDELSLLVFLTVLVRLVVFPSYRFLALSARNVAHNMSSCCHAALYSFALRDVDNFIEEVCFPVLASEVPAHNLIEVCQMGLASLTTKDLVGSQVNVV